MNPLAAAFADVYIFSGVLAAAGVLLRIGHRASTGQRLLSAALVMPLVVVYLLGMDRSAGVDFENYVDAYYEQGQPIPDIGYTAMTGLARELHLSFNAFLFGQGLLTIGVLWFVSGRYRADAVVVIAVYLLHLAIVRDMSQSRIGLAVAVCLLGQSVRRPAWRWLLYGLAVSIHVTVVVLIATWAYARAVSDMGRRGQVWLLMVPLALLSLFGSGLLGVVGALDPRIDFYLSWNDVGYGAPLASFAALLRSVPLLFIFIWAGRRFVKIDLRPYIVMELVGAAVLIGLADFSIFAARLSNVAISMYPIGLGIVAAAYRRVPRRERGLRNGVVVKAAAALVMAVLLIRPGSLDTLREVVPRTFEWLS